MVVLGIEQYTCFSGFLKYFDTATIYQNNRKYVFSGCPTQYKLIHKTHSSKATVNILHYNKQNQRQRYGKHFLNK